MKKSLLFFIITLLAGQVIARGITIQNSSKKDIEGSTWDAEAKTKTAIKLEPGQASDELTQFALYLPNLTNGFITYLGGEDMNLLSIGEGVERKGKA